MSLATHRYGYTANSCENANTSVIDAAAVERNAILDPDAKPPAAEIACVNCTGATAFTTNELTSESVAVANSSKFSFPNTPCAQRKPQKA